MIQTATILPDFLVIGAMKAGTTTLYDYLSRHPEVGMSREKETDFFIAERGWTRGLGWYSAQFTKGARIYGEASPNYTKREAFAGVPERAASVVPDARLIFIARDPVLRAASQYRHALLSGDAPVPPDGRPTPKMLQHLIDTSCYARQIDAWQTHYSADRFLFLQFEELVQKPQVVLTRLADFLGITDDWPAPAAPVANSAESLARLPPWMFRLRRSRLLAGLHGMVPAQTRGRLKALVRHGKAREVPPLPEEAMQVIAAALVADTARLRALTGQSFDGWRI